MNVAGTAAEAEAVFEIAGQCQNVMNAAAGAATEIEGHRIRT